MAGQYSQAFELDLYKTMQANLGRSPQSLSLMIASSSFTAATTFRYLSLCLSVSLYVSKPFIKIKDLLADRSS